jgi:hypothetical protein
MYSLQLLKLNAPIVKQTVAEAPEPLSFEDRLGRLMHVTGSRDTQLVYDYMDGFVVLTKLVGPAPATEQPHVVTILDMDDTEVAGTYGPYAGEAEALALAEVLLEGHQDDDPDTPYEYRVTPVYLEGGRG